MLIGAPPALQHRYPWLVVLDAAQFPTKDAACFEPSFALDPTCHPQRTQSGSHQPQRSHRSSRSISATVSSLGPKGGQGQQTGSGRAVCRKKYVRHIDNAALTWKIGEMTHLRLRAAQDMRLNCTKRFHKKPLLSTVSIESPMPRLQDFEPKSTTSTLAFWHLPLRHAGTPALGTSNSATESL